MAKHNKRDVLGVQKDAINYAAGKAPAIADALISGAKSAVPAIGLSGAIQDFAYNLKRDPANEQQVSDALATVNAIKAARVSGKSAPPADALGVSGNAPAPSSNLANSSVADITSNFKPGPDYVPTPVEQNQFYKEQVNALNSRYKPFNGQEGLSRFSNQFDTTVVNRDGNSFSQVNMPVRAPEPDKFASTVDYSKWIENEVASGRLSNEGAQLAVAERVSGRQEKAKTDSAASLALAEAVNDQNTKKIKQLSKLIVQKQKDETDESFKNRKLAAEGMVNLISDLVKEDSTGKQSPLINTLLGSLGNITGFDYGRFYDGMGVAPAKEQLQQGQPDLSGVSPDQLRTGHSG